VITTPCSLAEDIMKSPQLAILDALASTLANAREAILAAHPELISERWLEETKRRSLTTWIGSDAVKVIDALSEIARDYRRAVTMAAPPEI
jgi:hypothetical protein